jgi:hypothetical protein
METRTYRQEKLERIRLVARVQVARDEATEAIGRNDGSMYARTMVAAAKTRLALLNRALALMSLQQALSA